MIFPLAKGVGAVGLTRTSCQVRVLFVPEPLLLLEIVIFINAPAGSTITVIVPLTDKLFIFLVLVTSPAVSLTVGIIPPASNTKPLGALSIIVPVPISPLVASPSIGPVRVVQAPPTLSAEIDPPPVAAVMVTVPVPASVKNHSAYKPELCPVAVNLNVAPKASPSLGTHQVLETFPLPSAIAVNG